MKKENQKKDNKLGLVVFIFSIIICLFAVSYAAWTQIYQGEKENTIDTATLVLTLDESESNAISLINAVPVTDKKGLTYKPYTFKVKNSGTIDANYRIMIVNDTKSYENDGCSDKMLDWSNIKYSFAKNNEAATRGILSDTAGVLNLGTIKANETDSYSLQLWIKSEATNEIMNKHFHGIIKVEAVQSDQVLTD